MNIFIEMIGATILTFIITNMFACPAAQYK